MLEIKNAVKKYRKVTALDNVSFTVQPGRITCLLGINGVGKSTALKAIMGLIPLQSGEILVDGQKMKHQRYNEIAFIPDVPIHLPALNIGESFEFMKTFYDNWDMPKAYEMAEFFGLDLSSKLSSLSKGNMARVKLIHGFAQNSKYLLLDEPFSGMDIFSREDFIGAMTGKFLGEEQGVLLTTHEIGEIENLADDVILMDNGKIIHTFNAEEIRELEGKSIVDVMREVYRNGKNHRAC